MNTQRWRLRSATLCAALALVPAAAEAAPPKERSAGDGPAQAKAKANAKAEADAEQLPPMTSYQIEMEIQKREGQIEVDRKRGIALLEEFIDKHAANRAMPEALYRLASLYWERSQERFLAGMETYGDEVEACRAKPEQCPNGPPPEPMLDLSDSQVIYARLLKEHPSFRKIDTVMYLYAFSLRDQGHVDEAQRLFGRIIDEHPSSSFVPDSWMAIGDFRFYDQNNFATAKAAYGRVLDYPTSASYPMALFKTAWCHWKLGEREEAITRFKDVLDQGADPTQDAEARKRLADLRSEALEYLVQVLTEDETLTPSDVYDFLASIGGQKYSRKVLIRLSEAYENQTRYDKSLAGYTFLIELDKQHAEVAGFQIHVFIGHRGLAKPYEALAALAKVHDLYHPATQWGKAHPKESRAADKEAERLLYRFAKSVHESAQLVEKDTKVPDEKRYGLAVRAYTDYIDRYPANPRSVELAYLTGDILYFKLKDPGHAGDSYLRVGESAPVGKLHRDALLAAMSAYEEAMAANQATGERPAESDAGTPPATGSEDQPPGSATSSGTDAGSGGSPEAEGTKNAEKGSAASPDAPSKGGDGTGDAAKTGPDSGEDAASPEGEASPTTPAPTRPRAARTYNRWERGFIRATDLYASLFPEDDEIGAVVYRLGEFFYGRGDYDQAVRRFGKVAIDYPDSANAAAAGDRILESLAGAEDFDNIELWAAKLKSAPAFEAAEEQARLNRIIVESLLKQGETLASRGYYARAANYYLRVAAEYPKHEQAPLALNNAGASLERANRAKAATDVYRRLAKDYEGTKEAGEATLVVARVYENITRYEEAARSYDDLVENYPKHAQRAEALYNSGVLYQALGRDKEAITRYKRYAKQYSDREDALDVELRVGQVHAAAGQHQDAAKAFQRFLQRHPRHERSIEAQTRLGNSQIEGGKRKAAAQAFAKAAKAGREAQGVMKNFAAEARYRQGEAIYRQFEQAKLDERPNKLGKSLEKKAKLLNDAKEVFLDVISFGSPEWSTAALLKVGASFEGFAKDLRDYPVPKGLSEEDEMAYLEQLDTFALAFEEQAIEAYRSGYEKAIELGIYNEHTRGIREALGRLSKANYPPIAEIGTETVVAGSTARVAQPIRELGR